jgi:hypothetical protein
MGATVETDTTPDGLIRVSRVAFSTKAPTNAGWVHLESLKDLSILQIHGEELGDDGLSHLRELKGLKLLDLSFTRVGDAGLVHLSGLRNYLNTVMWR